MSRRRESIQEFKILWEHSTELRSKKEEKRKKWLAAAIKKWTGSIIQPEAPLKPPMGDGITNGTAEDADIVHRKKN